MFQMKEQDKIPEKDSNELEISHLPDKGFKITVLQVLTELRGTKHEQNENFKKKIKNIRK